LESYISESREQLEDEQSQKLSTSAEREKIEKDLTEVYNWFDEEGYDADEETLKKKLKLIKDSTKELKNRIREAEERPKAIAGMLQTLNLSTIFSESMLTMPDAKEIYTDKDRKDLSKILGETKTWFMTTWKKQNESDSDKNPVLLVKDIAHHQGKLDREMMYLINKAKYYVPKPKPKNDTTTKKSETDKTKTNSTVEDSEKKTEPPTKEEAKESNEEKVKSSNSTDETPDSKESVKLDDSKESVKLDDSAKKTETVNKDDTSEKKETVNKKHNPEDEL